MPPVGRSRRSRCRTRICQSRSRDHRRRSRRRLGNCRSCRTARRRGARAAAARARAAATGAAVARPVHLAAAWAAGADRTRSACWHRLARFQSTSSGSPPHHSVAGRHCSSWTTCCGKSRVRTTRPRGRHRDYRRSSRPVRSRRAAASGSAWCGRRSSRRERYACCRWTKAGMTAARIFAHPRAAQREPVSRRARGRGQDSRHTWHGLHFAYGSASVTSFSRCSMSIFPRKVL